MPTRIDNANHPTHTPTPEQPGDTTRRPGLLARGDKVGPYEIVDEVGSGGMGIVWRAHDRLLQRDVAIKQVMSPDAGDELARRRFRQEGELQKTVSQQCPRLVEVIELIGDARGFFIVMEFVEGVSLETLLAQHREPVPAGKVLTLLRDVGQALLAMHNAGVVHRDLKPGNILIGQAGAKVGDFGLATLVAQQEALPMGTAAYMAPEQFGEDAIDGRVDLYALGLIAYEMLIGRENYEHAFRAVLRDKRNRALRWMKWHTNTRAKVPAVSHYAPDVPPLLADLVDRMMAKDLPRRIQTAEQLLATIERHFITPEAGDDQTAIQRPESPASNGNHAPAGHALQRTTNGRTPARAEDEESLTALAVAASQSQPLHGAPAEDAHDGDLTAPLPTLSPRKKWLIGAAVATVVTLLGVGLHFDQRERQAQAGALADAEAAFATAMDALEEGDYDNAQRQWTTLANDWDNHARFGAGAQAYSLLAFAMQRTDEAEQAMLDGEYPEASVAYQEATEALARADDVVHGHEQARTAATRLIRRIQTAQADLPNRSAFARQAERIAAAVASAEFDEARRQHRELRRTLNSAGVALTSTERTTLNHLTTTIDDEEVRHQIASIDEQARRLISDGELDAAEELLKEARAEFEDRGLDDRLSAVTHQIAVTSANAAIASAERDGDLRAVAAAVADLYELDPSDELEHRVARAHADAALADARAARTRDDLEAATQYVLEAISHDDREEAQAMLRDLEGLSRRASLIQAGEAAYSRSAYRQAANLFHRALQMKDDAETQAKLGEALVRMYAAAVDAAIEADNLDAARSALSDAVDVSREHEATARARERVGAFAETVELRRHANAHHDGGRFGPAKRAFRQAIEIAEKAQLPLSPIRDRLAEVEIEHLILLATIQIDAERWREAWAYLRVAQNIKPTDDVQDLLDHVEREMAREQADDS